MGQERNFTVGAYEDREETDKSRVFYRSVSKSGVIKHMRTNSKARPIQTVARDLKRSMSRAPLGSDRTFTTTFAFTPDSGNSFLDLSEPPQLYLRISGRNIFRKPLQFATVATSDRTETGRSSTSRDGIAKKPSMQRPRRSPPRFSTLNTQLRDPRDTTGQPDAHSPLSTQSSARPSGLIFPVEELEAAGPPVLASSVQDEAVVKMPEYLSHLPRLEQAEHMLFALTGTSAGRHDSPQTPASDFTLSGKDSRRACPEQHIMLGWSGSDPGSGEVTDYEEWLLE